MRILWLCNIMLPMIAETLGVGASNKEGWLSGLASAVLERQSDNGIELAIAFPAPQHLDSAERHIYDGNVIYKGTARTSKGAIDWYAFDEDTANPHIYDDSLELQMDYIIKDYQPELVHCFGTEYPHTLAMCRSFPDKGRLLVGIQGLCRVYADVYFAELPQRVVRSVTLRDFLKRDSLRVQKNKFERRGEMEYEAVRLAGNVTGRTEWDKRYTSEWNNNTCYYKMNETLRPSFYTGGWSIDGCERHSIFLSQGDYPIKGLHHMLEALPAILEKFPDVRVYVAGNRITGDGGLKARLKISAYGKYLRSLIGRYGLNEHVCFLGKLDEEQMKQRYLKSNLFVCCSAIENSPNSLGEAMLLGVPCVSADVGGISSIFDGDRDGILYGNTCDLADSVIRMFSDEDKMKEYSGNAAEHARKTHDREINYKRLIEIYTQILEGNTSSGNECERHIEVCPQNADIPRFVFLSNYINHHQIPFCNAMFERMGGSFAFIQTQEMEEERVRMGWHNGEQLPYMLYFYEQPELCRKMISEADIVLFGGVDDESYIEERLKSGKSLIRYSERLYKEGQWKAVSPRGLIKKYKDHTRYRKKPVYLLCSGAYVPSDFHIVRAYPGKMLKWGYFPETRHYDVDKLMEEKKPASILWAARFLDWKHPEDALKCACYLKQKGLTFHMNIVGDGEQRKSVDSLMEKYQLSDCVTLMGYRTPEEVRALMEQTDIYLATSDRKEGWGAVINEAMNSGCAVVASHMMGAAPYLIRQGQNGVIYKSGDVSQLCQAVERLLLNRELCKKLGIAAMAAIEEVWNAEKAAENLINFCEKGEISKEGPCSSAEVVSERKMLWKIL